MQTFNKKYVFMMLLILGSMTYALGRPNTVEKKSAFSSIAISSSLDSLCYFTGKVVGNDVQLFLWKTDGRVYGRYIFDINQRPVHLSQVPGTAERDSLILVENATTSTQNQPHATWTLAINNGQLKGTWQNTDKTTQLRIHFKRTTPQQGCFFTYLRKKKTFAKKVESKYYDYYKLKQKLSIPIAVSLKENHAHWVNRQIKAIAFYDSTTTFTAGAEDFIRDNIDNYLHEFKTHPGGYLWSWKVRKAIRVKYNQKGYLVLADFDYGFYGGAHGIFGTDYHILDVTHKKKLMLKNIVTIDSVRLGEMIETQFHQDYQLSPSETLKDAGFFNNELPTSKNIYFSNKGLSFQYNIYQVTPFVMGTPTATLSWEELKPYLNKNLAKRMGLDLH